MARNPSKASTTATKPTHNVKLQYNHPKKGLITVGYVGLFEGNALHELMIKQLTNDAEAMQKFLSACTAEIIEYGESKDKIDSLF